MTLVCGFITFLVFRGTFGAGKFGTPFQDAEILNRELRSFQEKRLLKSRESQLLFLQDKMADRNSPYRAGPNITDWDEQRAEHIAMNPGCNATSDGRPRVMIVSTSQPKPCEHSVGDHFQLLFLKSKLDYARTHGMVVYHHMVRLDREMNGMWEKLPLLRRLMLAHPDIEWFWWIDSDSIITDMKFELPWRKYKDVSMVVPGWDDLVYKHRDWVGLSTGSFLLRNNQWSLDLLAKWAAMGARGRAREEAGRVLTAQLKGRPEFEADDQSALVWLLVSGRERWGRHVHLESKFYLHGYWVNLVNRFEEMMERFHAGFGDDRWPFVTHFVGCKPCGSMGEYDAAKCLVHMKRAFVFADNQVIKPYGFTHLHLNSSVVVPLVNVTTRAWIAETHYERKQQQVAEKRKKQAEEKERLEQEAKRMAEEQEKWREEEEKRRKEEEAWREKEEERQRKIEEGKRVEEAKRAAEKEAKKKKKQQEGQEGKAGKNVTVPIGKKGIPEIIVDEDEEDEEDEEEESVQDRRKIGLTKAVMRQQRAAMARAVVAASAEDEEERVEEERGGVEKGSEKGSREESEEESGREKKGMTGAVRSVQKEDEGEDEEEEEEERLDRERERRKSAEGGEEGVVSGVGGLDGSDDGGAAKEGGEEIEEGEEKARGEEKGVGLRAGHEEDGEEAMEEDGAAAEEAEERGGVSNKAEESGGLRGKGEGE
ncbi:unnamed protein product [Closterium sp. Yama58-4]|nr:unnamed protein product [Closterium sp. Yama58-4]